MGRVNAAASCIDRTNYVLPILFSVGILIIIIIENTVFANRPGFSATSYQQQLPVLAYVSANVQAAPINQLTVSTKVVGCPAGYEQPKLYDFLGIKSGCFCPASGDLYSVACPTTPGCQDIASRPAVAISSWDSNIFCVRRVSRFLRLTAAAASGAQPCPATYSPCGRSFCVSSEESCPLTEIVIKRTAGPVAQNYYQVLDTYQPGVQLLLARVYDAAPITDLIVSFGNAPCLDPSLRNQRPLHPLYIATNDTGCGRYGNDSNNALLIDQTSENFFYVNQNDNNLQVSDIPRMNEYMRYQQAKLFARKQVTINWLDASCQNLNWDVVSQLGSVLDDTSSMITVLLILTYSELGLFFFLCLCYFFRVIRTGEFTVGRFHIYLNLIAVMILITSIVHGALLISKRDTYNNLSKFYSQTVVQLCLQDVNIQRLILDLANSLPSNLVDTTSFGLALLLYSSIALGLLIIVYIIRFGIFKYRKAYVDYNDDDFEGSSRKPLMSGQRAQYTSPIGKRGGGDVEMIRKRYTKS